MNDLVTALEAAGFFAGLSNERITTLKKSFAENGWIAIYDFESGRFFQSDAEDLAEGGVGELLNQVQAFLNAHGVSQLEVEDDAEGPDYIVHVNGVAHVIYNETEFNRETNSDQPGLIWGLSMARGYTIINNLLEKAGSPERIYAVNGGNDLYAIFLTPEMHRIILAHPDVDPSSAPYQPAENYPWFGQPH